MEVFRILVWITTEYSELNELIYEILKEKSGESNPDDGCMACKVSGGSKDYQCH